MPKLEQWGVIPCMSAIPNPVPEDVAVHLVGTSTEDARNRMNGKDITTSRVRSFNFPAKQAQTKNTLYGLGTPHPEWVKHVRDSHPKVYAQLVEHGFVEPEAQA